MIATVTNEMDERFIELSDELNEEYFQKHGDISLKYGKYNCLDEPHIVVLILKYDKAIACGAFRVFDSESIEIRRVFVKKRHRNKGIAYRIVKLLEKIAIEEGFKYSYLVTGTENNEARLLYEKLDYEIIDNFGEFEGDGFCVCMRKRFKSMI